MSGMTDRQRFFFEANGYLVLEDALSADELAALRAAAAAAEARWRADPSLPGVRRPDLEQVMAILEYDPLFLDLLTHRRVFPILYEILGPDVMLLDHDYFISPPGATINDGWHYDTDFQGVDQVRSTVMAKVFYVLRDIPPDGGATLVLPGSHRFAADWKLPNSRRPEDFPGAVKMDLPAGSAYLLHSRTYHSAGNNDSALQRHLVIFGYGHKWMRVWQGYEVSPEVAGRARTPLERQLLGLTDPYGPNARWEAA